MKKVLIAAIVVATVTTTMPGFAKVQRNYDEFEDTSTLVVEIPKLPTEDKGFCLVKALFTFPGKGAPSQPNYVALAFMFPEADRVFQYGRQAAFIYGNTRMKFDNGEFFNNDHADILAIKLPVETFLEMASSKTMKCRVGSRDLTLTAKDMNSLKELASQLRTTK